MMITKFWWNNNKEVCIFWKKGQHLCLPKWRGGMCFQDLLNFNQALLAKQGWRLLQNSDSLLGSIMKAKYSPNSRFLNASLGHNPLYVWRSLIWGRDLLKIGFRWRVGSGSSIRASWISGFWGQSHSSLSQFQLLNMQIWQWEI